MGAMLTQCLNLDSYPHPRLPPQVRGKEQNRSVAFLRAKIRGERIQNCFCTDMELQ